MPHGVKQNISNQIMDFRSSLNTDNDDMNHSKVICNQLQNVSLNSLPEINILPPEKIPFVTSDYQMLGSRVKRCHVFEDLHKEDDFDNEVFLSCSNAGKSTLFPDFTPEQACSSPISTIDQKSEICSGRLFLLLHDTKVSERSPPQSTSSQFKSFTMRSLSTPSPAQKEFDYSPKPVFTTAVERSKLFLRSKSSPPDLEYSQTGSPTRSVMTKQHSLSLSKSTSVKQHKSKIAVFVRVYRYNVEHFAIVSRDAVYTAKPMYVNLRHSRVLPGGSLSHFVVTGKNCDSGQVLEFEVPALSDLEKWLDAFHSSVTPPVSPKHCAGGGEALKSGACSPTPRAVALPTVTEMEEEG